MMLKVGIVKIINTVTLLVGGRALPNVCIGARIVKRPLAVQIAIVHVLDVDDRPAAKAAHMIVTQGAHDHNLPATHALRRVVLRDIEAIIRVRARAGAVLPDAHAARRAARNGQRHGHGLVRARSGHERQDGERQPQCVRHGTPPLPVRDAAQFRLVLLRRGARNMTAARCWSCAGEGRMAVCCGLATRVCGGNVALVDPNYSWWPMGGAVMIVLVTRYESWSANDAEKYA